MGSDYLDWWAARAGQISAATVTSYRPQPEYGAALAMATAPLTTDQHSAMVNDIQTVRDEEEEQLDAWEALKRGRLGDAAGSVLGFLGDRFSDVNEARFKTQEAVFGEDYAEFSRSSDEAVVDTAGNLIKPVFESLDRTMKRIDRGLAVPSVMGGLLEARRGDDWIGNPAWLFEGETWREAWERTEHTTFGQASIERGIVSTPGGVPIFADGFDASGRPRNRAYDELRANNTAYNLASGSLDFLKVWYLAPEVLAAKGATTARALYKGDWDRLPPRQQARVRRLATTPTAHFERVKSQTPVWDVVGRRALQLREEAFKLRDQVRAGELRTADLAQFQAFSHSPQGALAAHLFTESSRARKLDPQTGRLTDEFDDDLFDTVSAVLAGHPGAIGRLAQRRDEVGDAVNALSDTRFGQLDDAVRLGEERLARLGSTDPAVRAQELMKPEYDLAKAVKDQSLIEMDLRQYAGYETWMHRALTEGPSLNMAPRAAQSVGQRIAGLTSRTYRPTANARHGATVVEVPLSVWRKRPGVASLHSSQESFETASRVFEQAAHITRGQHLPEDFPELRDRFLDNLAGAATDVDRAELLTRVEDIAVTAIGRKHNLGQEASRAVAENVRNLRSDLFTQAEKQMHTSGKNEIRVAGPDGTMEVIKSPVSLAQLKNSFVGIDLNVLDEFLALEANSVKAALATRPRQMARHSLETFNHYWKPSVLIRLGYPVRNVMDDALRGVGILQSMSYLVGKTPQALWTGTRNIPTRVLNRQRRLKNWWVDHSEPNRRPRDPQVIRETLGPIDAIDTTRLDKIRSRTAQVDRWERRALKNTATGKPQLKTPTLLTRFDEALADLSDAPRPVDAVTGKTRAGDEWETAFESSVRVVPEPNARGLSRYVEEFSDWLSNDQNALLLRRTKGGVELSVGRRNLLGDRAERRGTQPLARSFTGDVQVQGETFEGAFGTTGDMYRPANSSDPFNRNLYRSAEYNQAEAREATMQRTVQLGESGFEEAWSQAVNDFIRKDPVMRRMLDGWDRDEVLDWLKGHQVRDTPGAAGRQHARRHPHKVNLVKWVDELEGVLNEYLPTERLRAIARERDVTVDELAQLGPWEPRPVGVDLVTVTEAVGKNRVSQLANAIISRTMKGLATVPSDTLVRHPFFAQNYKYRLGRMMDQVDDAEPITPQVRQTMEKQAREFALNQTRRYMFSLADQSDFTHMLRFVSPFVSAWQESLVRWFRIVMERPEAFTRLYVQGWEQGFDKAYALEEHTDEYTGEQMVKVPVPKSVWKGLAAVLPNVDAKDLEGFESVDVSKRSLNITLQGSPWWLPSGGPMVQLPAAYLLKNSPELADENALTEFAWNWLFPAGRPRVENFPTTEGIAPSWMQQFARYHAESDDPVYQNLGLLVYQNDHQRWRDGGKVGPEPTIRESFDKAHGIQFFMTASRLGSPFAFRLVPESQLWIDKAREYRDLHGDQEGLLRFVEDMGEDAYMWWQSKSKANLNVPPTSEGYKQYERFQTQLEKYPELAPLIVGQQAFDDGFNSEVYRLGYSIPVAPGSTEKIRESKSGEEFQADIESRQGWEEWTNWRTAIDAELAARGLHSINQKGAEDLLAANDLFKKDQFAKLPGWKREFEQFDAGKGYAYVATLRNWVESGNANPSRPEVRGLANYVELHDAFAAELDARKTVGGSRSIEAQSNYDLAFAWDIAVGELRESNPAFAEYHARYLDRHQLRNGSN